MRIAKHILYYLSVPAAIVLWLGGYVLLDALIFPLENLEYLVAAILFIYGYFFLSEIDGTRGSNQSKIGNNSRCVTVISNSCSTENS